MRSFPGGLSQCFFLILASLVAIPLSGSQITQTPRPLVTASRSEPDDWPMVRHDARNTSRSTASVLPPLRLLWRVPTYSSVEPFLLASSGVVAVTRRPANVVQQPEVTLYDRNGRRAWQLTHAIPVYLKGSRIVVSLGNQLASNPACYDWRSGTQVWSQPLARQQGNGSACVLDGRLYWAQQESNRAALRILNLSDGQIQKEAFVESGWWEGPPACDGELVYWGVSHWLRIFDAQSLEPKWAYYEGGNAYPMRIASQLIIQGWSHGMQSLDLTQKKSVWGASAWRGAAHALTETPVGRPILLEAQSIPEAVTGFDPATGDALWHHPLLNTYGGGDVGTVAGSGPLFYVPGWHRNGPSAIRGGFYALDAATGKLRWKYERPGVSGACMIVSDGRVYALDRKGTLYCFAPKKH